MLGQEIYCTVSSCFYNGSGDKCKASKIMVKNNPETLRNANMEVGSLGGMATQSFETLCETYVPRENGPKPGIERLS
jgi:hypothetical protein